MGGSGRATRFRFPPQIPCGPSHRILFRVSPFFPAAVLSADEKPPPPGTADPKILLWVVVAPMATGILQIEQQLSFKTLYLLGAIAGSSKF